MGDGKAASRCKVVCAGMDAYGVADLRVECPHRNLPVVDVCLECQAFEGLTGRGHALDVVCHPEDVAPASTDGDGSASQTSARPQDAATQVVRRQRH